MRAIIQRVAHASVTIEQKEKATIEQGFLVLLGIEPEDELADIQWLAKKISGLRVFSDEEGKMNRSIEEINGEIIVVSQFTLFASTKKGNRPSFIRSAKPDIAIPLYEQFVQHLQTLISTKIQTGEFGADMKVNLLNDGPVTIFIDTKNKE